MTAIDTSYEYAGFKLAGLIQELFGSVGLPAIVALAGTAYVVHEISSDRASIRALLVHLLFIAFMAWFLSPVQDAGVTTPRFVSWLGRATDFLQKRSIERVNERFLDDPFEWERLAAMSGLAAVRDPMLAREMAQFLDACARRRLAESRPRFANLFRPGAYDYAGRCREMREDLWTRIREHVREHRSHRAVLDSVQARSPGEAEDFFELYLDQIAVRAIDGPGGPLSEAGLVAASLGKYSYVDESQSTGPRNGFTQFLMGPLFSHLLPGDKLFNAAVSGVAEIHQDWMNRFDGKQKYFLATVYGPHIYGLALLFMIGLFPIVGLFALAPGRWMALLNYGKVFISIKLWPVCWAALSTYNAARPSLEAIDPAARASGNAFLAVASMYLLTPALSFLVVHLATAAAAAPFSQAVPSPSGPGLGPAGPVVKAAR